MITRHMNNVKQGLSAVLYCHEDTHEMALAAKSFFEQQGKNLTVTVEKWHLRNSFSFFPTHCDIGKLPQRIYVSASGEDAEARIIQKLCDHVF